MTDLPEEEREAMEAISLPSFRNDEVFREKVWRAAREYSKQREEKLREALETIELSVPGLHAPEPRWRRFAESLQEIARAALAENGDSNEISAREMAEKVEREGLGNASLHRLGDRRPGT